MDNTFYCTNCGTEVKVTESYCPICGARLDDYTSRQNIKNEVYATDSFNSMPVTKDTGKHRSSIGRIIGLIGALLVIASVFLPFLSYGILGFGESISLMDHENGIIILVIAVIVLILFALRSKIFTFIMAVIMCGISYFVYQNTMSMLSEMGILSGVFDREIGFYGMIIGAVFIALGAVINFFE